MAEETEEGTVTVNELDCLFKLLHIEMNAKGRKEQNNA